MADKFTKNKRSEIMSHIKSKNTKPEITVRKIIFSLGYRYRLHRKELPGKPDIVFLKLKKAIFINGCFWHGHSGCKKSRLPITNKIFWKNKISLNIKRDKTNYNHLEKMNWDILIIWQCEISKSKYDSLITKIINYLTN